MKVEINWKYSNSGYGKTTEEFDSEKDFQKFWSDAINDHSERKPIGINRL